VLKFHVSLLCLIACHKHGHSIVIIEYQRKKLLFLILRTFLFTAQHLHSKVFLTIITSYVCVNISSTWARSCPLVSCAINLLNSERKIGKADKNKRLKRYCLRGGIAQGVPYTATITDILCFPISVLTIPN
jgi:hypothetical protein